MKLRSVVAVSHGGQAVELVLSSYPMSCDDAVSAWDGRAPGATLAKVTIAPVVMATGAAEWSV